MNSIYGNDPKAMAKNGPESIVLHPDDAASLGHKDGDKALFKSEVAELALPVAVDEHYQTSVPGIFAIGDVIAGPMLAHKAEDEGMAVAENIAGLTGIVNHDVIPSVVYTTPEFAGVGLTEEAAKAKGEIKVGKFPMMANSRAKTNHEPDGFVKIIADAKSDRVIGVWAIAVPAGTMIAEAALGMEMGATSEDIAYTCHAHPTHSEAIKEAAMAVRGKAIHV